MEKQNEDNNLDKISQNTKIEIISHHIEPAYKQDVKQLIHGKRCWRLTGQTFETLSKVFVAIGSIVSFAAGVYNEQTLSFVSGAISTVSLAALQFASFSYRENKKQSHELNSLLKNINVAAIPTLERTADDNSSSSPYQQRQASSVPRSDNHFIPYTQYIEEMEYNRSIIIARENELNLLHQEINELKRKKEEQTTSESKDEEDSRSSQENFVPYGCIIS